MLNLEQTIFCRICTDIIEVACDDAVKKVVSFTQTYDSSNFSPRLQITFLGHRLKSTVNVETLIDITAIQDKEVVISVWNELINKIKEELDGTGLIEQSRPYFIEGKLESLDKLREE